MLSLFIEDEDIVVKDIDKDDLEQIAKWFGDCDCCRYKYAMGIDKVMTIDDLYEKYLESLLNAHEYFLSININREMIGFIKGRVEYKDKDEVWIMSLFIDPSYQGQNIGSRAVSNMLREFNQKMGICSFYACLVKNNIRARKFWERNGFVEYRTSKGYFTIDNKSCDLIIMQRGYES